MPATTFTGNSAASLSCRYAFHDVVLNGAPKLDADSSVASTAYGLLRVSYFTSPISIAFCCHNENFAAVLYGSPLAVYTLESYRIMSWPMFMPVVLANVELYRVAPELSKSKS